MRDLKPPGHPAATRDGLPGGYGGATVRRMPTPTRLAALSALLLAACGGAEQQVPEEEPIPIVQVLPNIPLPPGGQPLTSERGGDAAQLVVSTPMMADSVIAFYRELLSQPPYRLMNEATERSITSFYVEQEGPSLWVTVEGLAAGGTLVRLAGAAVRDTVVAAPQAGS